MNIYISRPLFGQRFVPAGIILMSFDTLQLTSHQLLCLSRINRSWMNYGSEYYTTTIIIHRVLPLYNVFIGFPFFPQFPHWLLEYTMNQRTR